MAATTIRLLKGGNPFDLLSLNWTGFSVEDGIEIMEALSQSGITSIQYLSLIGHPEWFKDAKTVINLCRFLENQTNLIRVGLGENDFTDLTMITIYSIAEETMGTHEIIDFGGQFPWEIASRQADIHLVAPSPDDYSDDWFFENLGKKSENFALDEDY